MSALGDFASRATILRASSNGQAFDCSASSRNDAAADAAAVDMGLLRARTLGMRGCGVNARPHRALSASRLSRSQAPSVRIDRKIPQPQVGEAAFLPQAKQAPVEREPQRVVAAFDRDADALAEVAALDERPAREDAAVAGVGAVEPERQRKAVAEQEIDLAPPECLARQFGGLVRAHVGLGEQGFEI